MSSQNTKKNQINPKNKKRPTKSLATAELKKEEPRSFQQTSVSNAEQLFDKTKMASGEVLKETLHKSAEQSRIFGRMAAVALRDPQFQEALGKVLTSGGEFSAVLLENLGELLGTLLEANAPAMQRLTFLAADTIQNTIVNLAGGAIGTIPGIGDVLATAIEEFTDVNENALGALWVSLRTIPPVGQAFVKAVQKAGRSLDVLDNMANEIHGVGVALDNLADKADAAAANAVRATANLSPQEGGNKKRRKKKTRRRRKKIRRRQKKSSKRKTKKR